MSFTLTHIVTVLRCIYISLIVEVETPQWNENIHLPCGSCNTCHLMLYQRSSQMWQPSNLPKCASQLVLHCIQHYLNVS